jgi:hypothetical protein
MMGKQISWCGGCEGVRMVKKGTEVGAVRQYDVLYFLHTFCIVLTWEVT